MHSNRRFGFPISSSLSPSLTFMLLLLLLLTSQSMSEVYTSTDKIIAIAMQESSILGQLRSYINDQYKILNTLTRFLNDREKIFNSMSSEKRIQMAQHPNGAFIFMKYTNNWHTIINENPTFRTQVDHLKSQLPTFDDYSVGLNALIRLQRTYRLRAEDMYAGNYSGHLGPPLEPNDPWILGRHAFLNGHLKECIEWLELAKDKLLEEEERAVDKVFWSTSRSYAMALLGRSYLFINRTEEARTLYNECMQSGHPSGDITQLGLELNQPGLTTYSNYMPEFEINMTELCTRDKTQRVAEIRPYHICRYKPSLYLPYLRYEEEILSVAPFASLFYNVVSDREIEALKTFVQGKMQPGETEGPQRVSDQRISNVGWIIDADIDVVRTLSLRIKSMTWLEVVQPEPNGPYSSEHLQVVNYGLGGHYTRHMDVLQNVPEVATLRDSGGRIATFLIYLNDVEKGGHTIFSRLGISVAAKKGMALFWYNFDSTMTVDMLTEHAGCPVLVGQKWIANKWILEYGNMFTRPCGPSPTSTQLDIENLMYSRSGK